MTQVVAFDCFGTLFDVGGTSRAEIDAYVSHVNADDFTPYAFPESWWNFKPHPDVKDGIERIQAMGILCVALSNGSVELLSHLAKNAGFEFDFIVDLVFHKIYKPNPPAYLLIEKDLGFKPANTLMVTANPTFGDLEGAAAAGMPSKVIRHGYPNTVGDLADFIAEQRTKAAKS